MKFTKHYDQDNKSYFQILPVVFLAKFVWQKRLAVSWGYWTLYL